VTVAAQEDIHPEQIPELIPELIEVPATEPEIIAQTEVTVTEPETIEQTEIPATVPVFDEQATVESLASSGKNDVTEPTGDEAPELIALNSTDESVEVAPDVVQEIETSTRTPVLPDAKTGKWVINISSYTRKPTAERMLLVFKQKGIDAEVFTTTINDKPMHRIRVTGFQSSRAAKAEIPAIEKTLDLEGIWISKR
jgi:cell division septation protein DedD